MQRPTEGGVEKVRFLPLKPILLPNHQNFSRFPWSSVIFLLTTGSRKWCSGGQFKSDESNARCYAE